MLIPKWLLPMLLFGVSTTAVTQVAEEAVPAPSFDCAKARGRTEKLICSSPMLGRLDRQVAEWFALAANQAPEPEELKREQRRWLADRDDCKDAACVEHSYRYRLARLVTLTGKLPPEEARQLCTAFTDPETRSQALAVISGREDINNDGTPDRASRCSGGTANIPCVEYFDSNDKPLAILPQGFEWLTYSALGRATFRAGDRTFTYHSLDDALEQPAFLSYITPGNRELRVCDFDTVVGSAVVAGGEDVCAAVESSDERIESFEVVPVGDAARFAVDRPDTTARALAKIDIDNDGLEENLVEYAYSSGAGRGCENNYFELLADDGTTLASNSNAAAVRELQGLTERGASGRNCGLIRNRLFRFEDKVYYETNATNAEGVPHEVRLLRGTAVSTVCTFEREIKSTVKTLY
jgi:uncharacterized protein YecT (DUF1311 family)